MSNGVSDTVVPGPHVVWALAVACMCAAWSVAQENSQGSIPVASGIAAPAQGVPRAGVVAHRGSGRSENTVPDAGPAHEAIAAASVPLVVGEYLETYCVDCHGPDTRKGDLRLDTLEFDPAD